MREVKVTVAQVGTGSHWSLSIESIDPEISMEFDCGSYRYLFAHEFDEALLVFAVNVGTKHVGKTGRVTVFADAIRFALPGGEGVGVFADEMICQGLKP